MYHINEDEASQNDIGLQMNNCLFTEHNNSIRTAQHTNGENTDHIPTLSSLLH